MSPTSPNGKQFSGANAAWNQDIGANCTLSPSTPPLLCLFSHYTKCKHTEPCDCSRSHFPFTWPMFMSTTCMAGKDIFAFASAIVPGVTSAEVSPWRWWNITKERKSFAKLCWSEPSRTTTMNARTTGSVERTGRTTEQPQQKRSQLWSKCIRSH